MIEKIKELPKFELVEIITRDGQEIEKFKAIREIESKEIITIVSNKYKLVQFEEAFMPLALSFDYKILETFYYRGKAMLEMWNEKNVGIIARNSVDKSLAIHIRYAVKENGYIFILRGFRRLHVGKVKTDLETIFSAIDKLKEIWNNLLVELKNAEVNLSEFEKELKLPKKLKEEIQLKRSSKEMKGEIYSYYDLWIDAVNFYRKRKYKSEIKRMEMIEKVCDRILDVLKPRALDLLFS